MVHLRPSLPLDEIIHKLKLLEERAGESVPQDEPLAEMPGAREDEELLAQKPSTPLPSPEGKEEIWQKFLDLLQKKKASIASMLEQGNLLSITQEEMEIGLNPDSFLWEKINEPEYLKILKDTAHGVLQRVVRIKITPSSPTTDEPSSRKPLNQKDRLRKAQDEAINHPAVKEVLEILGGKVVDVKINQ
jgi:hypothetical protein